MLVDKALPISDPEGNIFSNTELNDGLNVLIADGVSMTYQQLIAIVVAAASSNPNVFDVTSVVRLLAGKIFSRITYQPIRK